MGASKGSVSNQVARLKEGEPEAVQQLWVRYSQRLINLARGKLPHPSRLGSSEEDVALSAFASFFRAVERDRFPRLQDRHDLWQILVMLAHRKIHKLYRRKTTPVASGRGPDELVLEVISWEPSPQEAVEVAEECERLLHQLKSSKLRQVALWKLEGYTNEEIAEKLGCVSRTVERKVQAIRDIWATGQLP